MAAIFTPAADHWLRQAAFAGVGGAALAVAAVYYYAAPEYTRVGHRPLQPVAFSHAQHVGQLGMDCRYCHNNVEQSGVANVPATYTCLNCHKVVKANSPLIQPLLASDRAGQPMAWKRVHRVPDYAQFNHAAHVTRGVACQSCHGQINEMPVVHHDQPLSMAWCLSCHREPELHLRPRDQVTSMTWTPGEGRSQLDVGKDVKDRLNIRPPQTCQGCHR